jgi:hypothetical protein
LFKFNVGSERRALEVQIQEFGQTPRQIFFAPHPLRGGEPEAPDAPSIPAPPAGHIVENRAALDDDESTSGAAVNEASTSSMNEKDVTSSRFPRGARIGNNVVAILSKTRLGKAISSSLSKEGLKGDPRSPPPARGGVPGGPDATTTTAPSSTNEKETNDGTIVELGKDFQVEVERALRESQSEAAPPAPVAEVAASAPAASPAAPAPSVGSWVGYLRGGPGGDPPADSKTATSNLASDGRRLRDGANLILYSVDQIKCHTDSITDISFSSDGRTVSSTSKDSTMKVI